LRAFGPEVLQDLLFVDSKDGGCERLLPRFEGSGDVCIEGILDCTEGAVDVNRRAEHPAIDFAVVDTFENLTLEYTQMQPTQLQVCSLILEIEMLRDLCILGDDQRLALG
jgi:hypothetical protein